MTASILLLGESNVGKSHFGGQLLGRLNREEGALRMVGSPTSLAPFDTVLSSLNAGLAAKHTSAASYTETLWPVTNSEGRSIDLVWPEYGGEQVSEITAQRRMSPEWRRRVETSDGWIVMVRIPNAQVSDDIFTRPLLSANGNGHDPKAYKLSNQAKLVDFLQWLSFVRGINPLVPTSSPRLLLLLSCWDELPPAQIHSKPANVLLERMPLVSAFIQANWTQEAASVIGLSALERSLSENLEDTEYVDMGPENFGYVVTADGEHNRDLTLAIAPLVGIA